MLISSCTRPVMNYKSHFDCIGDFAAAGFDCIDISLFDMEKGNDSVFLKDSWLDYAKSLKAEAHRCGVFYNQAHAPYKMDMKKYLQDENAWQDISLRLTRAIEVAATVGAEYIVVHPIHFWEYSTFPRDKGFEINKEFYLDLAKTAKKCGIKIAIENMWERDRKTGKITYSVCSAAHELAYYIDELNKYENCFVACLDIGHCVLVGENVADAISILGARLKALHIHDNEFKSDKHMLPTLGKTDYAAVMNALKENNYSGVFTLESHGFISSFDPSFHNEALKFSAKTARHLVKSVDL